MTYTELSDCVFAHWTPTIGDPNWTGWATVAVYAFAFSLSLMVASIRQGIRRRWMWWLLAALLLFLGINKQLDLQTALTTAGRCLAYANGWYAKRRIVQEDFLLALAAFGIASLLLTFTVLGEAIRQSGIAFLGLCVLGTFVMMRAISFHHFDALLGMRAFGVTTNFIFENTGLVMICVNAILLIRRHRHSRPRPE